MNNRLKRIIGKGSNNSDYNLEEFIIEHESKAYDACRYTVNNKIFLERTAKITPIKIGQFVTFWKRASSGVIAPFSETDQFDFFSIHVSRGKQKGQFVFPKDLLITKGIVATTAKAGKRGFRVYPPWTITTSKLAIKSQKWQLQYFYIDGMDNNFIKKK